MSEDNKIVETNQNNSEANTQQAPIDLMKIFTKLWAARKLYFIVLPIVLIGTYLLTLTMPRYYKCQVELAPESSESSASGSLSSIASSFGLGNIGKLAGSEDAINVMLYPDLLQSPDFIVTLFPIKVTTKDGATYTYYDYMAKHQKAPFWLKYIIGPLHELMDPHKPSPAYKAGEDKIDIRHLSRKQDETVQVISGQIKCVIDKKTDAISIIVTDQDPEVCATIGDSVLNRIQNFIVEYRTKKARNDYNYYKKLLDEAKGQYDRALGNYAGYSDSHRNAIDQTVIAKTEDSNKNMTLKYQTYSTLAMQLQAAEAKIQENTPAFTVIKSATLPHKPAGPKRTLIALAMTILVGMGISGWILFRKEK